MNSRGVMILIILLLSFTILGYSSSYWAARTYAWHGDEALRKSREADVTHRFEQQRESVRLSLNSIISELGKLESRIEQLEKGQSD